MCKGLCANGFQDQNMVETPLLSLRLALATPPVTISCVRQIDVFKWFQRAWHEAISFCVASMSSSNANMSRALMVQEKWSTLFLQGLKTLEIRDMNCRVVKLGEEVHLIASGQGKNVWKEKSV